MNSKSILIWTLIGLVAAIALYLIFRSFEIAVSGGAAIIAAGGLRRGIERVSENAKADQEAVAKQLEGALDDAKKQADKSAVGSNRRADAADWNRMLDD